MIARLDRLLAPYGGLGAIRPRRRRLAPVPRDEIDVAARHRRDRAVDLPGGGRVPAQRGAVAHRRLQREQIATLKALGYGEPGDRLHYLKLVPAIALVGRPAGRRRRRLARHGMTAHVHRLLPLPDPALPRSTPRGRGGGGARSAWRRRWRRLRRGARARCALPPAEAMRPEPPGHYRRSAARAPRRRALAARQPTRMVAAQPAAPPRPHRAVGGRHRLRRGDAHRRHLLARRRRRDDASTPVRASTQRFDVTVDLRRAACRRARSTRSSALPGVLAAEPFRAVPVRLRAGHRAASAAITGLAPTARARPRGRRRPRGRSRCPPRGLVLSAELGRAARRRGRRPRAGRGARGASGRCARCRWSRAGRRVMGTSAYMDSAPLHRLLEEGARCPAPASRSTRPASAQLYRRAQGDSRGRRRDLSSRPRSRASSETLAENMRSCSAASTCCSPA